MNHKHLKIFALCAMLFDHTVLIFPLEDLILPLCNGLTSQGYDHLGMWLLDWLPYILRYIGRTSAPIFLFCLVQGFLHTHDVRKYIARIFVTAIAAQGPYILFDLAQSRLYGMVGDWRDSGVNILFTLGLGLLALTVFEHFHQKGRTPLGYGAVILAGALARLLQLEGHEGYILIIFAFYLLRNSAVWKKVLVFIPIILLSRFRLVAFVCTEPRMLQACVLNVLGNYMGILITFFYTGEKGNSGKGFQRFMYAFYPLHLLLLAIIGYLRPLFS